MFSPSPAAPRNAYTGIGPGRLPPPGLESLRTGRRESLGVTRLLLTFDCEFQHDEVFNQESMRRDSCDYGLETSQRYGPTSGLARSSNRVVILGTHALVMPVW